MRTKNEIWKLAKARCGFHQTSIEHVLSRDNRLRKALTELEFEYHSWFLDKMADVAMIADPDGGKLVNLETLNKIYQKLQDGYHENKSRGPAQMRKYLDEGYKIERELSVRSSEPEYRQLGERDDSGL